jgi:protein SCO1/2
MEITSENKATGQYPIDHWSKKIVASKAFWAIFVLLAFSYPVYRSMNRVLPPALPKMFQVPEFKLFDQNGNSFGSQDLKGKAYIANFVFTSCPTTCPGLMEKMQEVQKRIRGVGDRMSLVTFTVDPETDTVEKLQKYSQELKASPQIWKFLTGDKNEIKKTLIDGFKVPMGDKAPVTDLKLGNSDLVLFDIVHTEKLVLVDEVGFVRGYYSTDKISIDQLMIDVGLMINRL